MGSAVATASAGASTKRRSRAEALKCLEGRRLSSLTGASSSSRERYDPAGEDVDGDSEDEDPWSHHLPDPGRSHSEAQAATFRASSHYSTQNELQREEAEVPVALQMRTAAVPYANVASHNPDDIASFRDQAEEQPSRAVKHSSFGMHVKTALRLSSNDSDEGSVLREPARPSAAHLADSRKERAWSQYATRRESLNAFSPPLKWPPSPYSPSANASLDKRLAPVSRQKRSPHQTLGWNQPYWTPAMSTRKDVYHRVERSPYLANAGPFHEVDLHQRAESKPDQPTEPTDEAYSQPTRLGLLASTTIWFSCLGLHHSFGVFQSYYTMHYPASSQTSISFVGSTQLALTIGIYALTSTATPYKKYVRRVGMLGALLVILGTLCTSWCTSLLSIWLMQGVLTGLGMALALQAAFATVMSDFMARSAIMILALAFAAGHLGGILYTLVINELLVRYTFATATRVLAGVVTIALLPPVIMLCWKRHLEEPQQQPVLHAENPYSAPQALAAFGIILVFLGLQILPTYMPVFAATAGDLESNQGAHLLALMCATAVFGCSLTGLAICHGFRDSKVGGICSVLAGVVVLAWLDISAHSSFGDLAILSTLYGLFSPAIWIHCLVKLCALGQDSYGITDTGPAQGSPRWSSDRLSNLSVVVLMTSISLAALVGSPVAGALIQLHPSTTSPALSNEFFKAKIFAGVTLFAGGVVLLASSYIRTGK